MYLTFSYGEEYSGKGLIDQILIVDAKGENSTEISPGKYRMELPMNLTYSKEYFFEIEPFHSRSCPGPSTKITFRPSKYTFLLNFNYKRILIFST